MKAKTLVSVAMLASTLPLAAAALAECNSNKVPLTLINPAGKVIELCVPEKAVAGIEAGASDLGAQLVQGHCPCFTQEEVEAVDSLVCQVTYGTPIKCTSALGNYEALACSEDQACKRTDYCLSPGSYFDRTDGTTKDELVACMAILAPLVSNSP